MVIVNCFSNDWVGEPLSVVRTRIEYEFLTSKLKLAFVLLISAEISKRQW